MQKRLLQTCYWLFTLACFMVCGCTAFDYRYGTEPPAVSSSGSRPSSNLQNSRIKTELARMQADIRQLTETQRKLRGRIQEINGRISGLRADLNSAMQGVASDDNRGSQAVASLRRQVESLQKALEAEKKARKSADREVVRSVTSEVSSMIANSGSGRASDSNLQARGKYTVKRGDTLSAIAQAFGVKVKDLKRLNNLQTDLITEGQKLLIPRN